MWVELNQRGIMALDIGKLKYFIYLLAVSVFYFAYRTLLFYIVIESKIAIVMDFTALEQYPMQLLR